MTANLKLSAQILGFLFAGNALTLTERVSAPQDQYLHILPVISTCETGMTIVEKMFDTI